MGRGFRALAIILGIAAPIVLLGALELVLRVLESRIPQSEPKDVVVRQATLGKFALAPVLPPRPSLPRPLRRPGYAPAVLAPIQRTPQPFFTPDPEAAFRGVGRPNAAYRTVVRRSSGELLANVDYHFDEFGRRVVPGQSGARPRFAAFFGCSFVFGEAVNDDETLPYYFARADQRYDAYNYGAPGWGTSNVWLKIRNHDFSRELKEPGGIGVYLFIDFHVLRNAGSVSVIHGDGMERPYVVEGKNGEPELKGSFREGRPLTTRLYEILAQSRIWWRTGKDLPNIGEADLRLAASMMHQMAVDFERKTGGKFYVILYPQRKTSAIVPFLEKEGVHYLDLSDRDLQYDLAEEDHIPFEGHPTAAAYRWLANVFAESLKKVPASFSAPQSGAEKEAGTF